MYISRAKELLYITAFQSKKKRNKGQLLRNRRFSPVFYRTASPSEPLPCSLSIPLHSLLSRARVSLSHTASAVYWIIIGLKLFNSDMKL